MTESVLQKLAKELRTTTENLENAEKDRQKKLQRFAELDRELVSANAYTMELQHRIESLKEQMGDILREG